MFLKNGHIALVKPYMRSVQNNNNKVTPFIINLLVDETVYRSLLPWNGPNRMLVIVITMSGENVGIIY